MTRYQHKPKLYTLRFEDHPGFEVVMRGLSINAFMGVARMAGKLTGAGLAQLEGEQLKEALGAADSLFATFARALRSWNLDDEDGRPVPAVYGICTESGKPKLAGNRCKAHAEQESDCEFEGVIGQDLDFVLEITLAWMDAIASVDTPLPSPASSPGTSQESSLQLASSSQSLSS